MKKTIIITLIVIIAIVGCLLLRILALPFISFVLDMKTPSKDDIFEYVETTKKLPQTSAINEEQYKEYFSKLLEKYDEGQ